LARKKKENIMNTPAFTLTITGETGGDLKKNLLDMLPSVDPRASIDSIPLQELLLRVDERCEAEGYEMEVWKKGERPEPELPLAERKKAEARAKLRGDLVNSLAEATHATSAVKEEIEAEAEAAPVPETETETPPKKTRAKKGAAPKTNGNAETEDPQALKDRIILRLQELYGEGRKADVNKLLAAHGNGVKTFSAIPADQFGPIAEAVEAL
jgi:hypothetical protein